jgi:hypothetical protein
MVDHSTVVGIPSTARDHLDRRWPPEGGHMFIQVIKAKTSRRDEAMALMQEWNAETPPDSGFLGGTFGFTDDNTFLGVVRFESKESAMANSDRPETSANAEKMAALMDGPPEFHDCDDVTVWMDGGSDDAGFVQVITGKTNDPAELKAVLSEDTSALREMRPEIIGGTLAIEADGTYFQTVAFTDEASAREGEQKPPPDDVRDRMQAAFGESTYYDLRDPWFEGAS